MAYISPGNVVVYKSEANFKGLGVSFVFIRWLSHIGYCSEALSQRKKLTACVQ